MDIELAATHEAGHAVMQWLVDLELGELQMKIDGTNASDPSTCCPRLPLPTLSDLRKRLLVLLAGNAVTLQRWPDSWNDDRDWFHSLLALKEHMKLDNLAWVIDRGQSAAERFRRRNEPQPREVHNRKTDSPKANSILQDAIARCREIVADPLFQRAVDQVAAAFIAAPIGDDGVTRFGGPKAVEICDRVIGQGFRAEKPWSAWIADERT